MEFGVTKPKIFVAPAIAFLLGFLSYSGPQCVDCSAATASSIALRNFTVIFVWTILLAYSLWSLFENREKDRHGLLFYALGVIAILFVAAAIGIVVQIFLEFGLNGFSKII